MKVKFKSIWLLVLLGVFAPVMSTWAASSSGTTTYSGKATASISSGSTGSGTVYASESKTTPTSGWTSSSSTATASGTSSSLSVYLHAKADTGSTFVGWATSASATSATDTANPKTVSGTGSTSTPSFGTFYAVFKKDAYYARAIVNVSSSYPGGKVCVNTSNAARTYGSTDSIVTETSTSGGGCFFYAFAQPDPGYKLVIWSTDPNTLTGYQGGSPGIMSINASSQDSGNPSTLTWYAAFDKIQYYGKAEAGISTGGAGTSGGTVSVSTSSTAGSYSTSASVTYNSAPGAASASQTVYYFAKANTGYEFVGWSTSSSGTSATYTGSPYSTSCSYSSESSGSPTAATKLYAVFKAKTYYGKAEAGISTGGAGTSGGTVSVSTSSTAGSYSSSASVTYNSAPGASSASKTIYYFAKANTGYEFVGWSTSSSGTSAAYVGNPFPASCSYSSTSSDSPTVATKLYAVFGTIYYGKAEVLAECAGGTVSVSKTASAGTYGTFASVAYNKSSTSSSASQQVYYFAKADEGYEFVGWTESAKSTSVTYTANPYCTSRSCSSKSSGSPTAATTLYAVFRKLPSVTLISAAQRYPWGTAVDYTYSLADTDSTKAYKLAVELTLGGVTKSVTNELEAVENDVAYTQSVELSGLFANGTKDPEGKIDLTLIETTK